MSSSAIRAIVPLVGGLTLLVGCVVVLYIDRLDCLADPHQARPILIRYTSQATYDLHKRPHWIFVAVTTVFGPCLIVTAAWQAELVEQMTAVASNGGDDIVDIGVSASDLRLFSIGCALGGFLVSTLPMGNCLGFVWHMISAGCFASFGFNYCFRARDLANAQDHEALVVLRTIFVYMGIAGAALMLGGVPIAGTATEQLEEYRVQHQEQDQARHTTSKEEEQQTQDVEENDKLPATTKVEWTRDQLKALRIKETVLACGQFLTGVSMGLTLLTAVVEVGDLEKGPDDYPVWVIGLVSFAAFAGLAGIFWAANESIYNVFQAPKEDDEKNAAAEEEPRLGAQQQEKGPESDEQQETN
mmetsp:Transcript_16160/g.30777  ORF Transcript_16160/g.30777 Transcript_16160/m.30777 type:complete len:357 (+) Transcript_16160:186-1256(+)|eukprot:scaffold5532_cov180-Amphora_coffeaeformis.AAC.2